MKPQTNIIKPIKVSKIQQALDLKVFNHCLYEYKKGVRSLILTTEKSSYEKIIKDRLDQEKIDYIIQEVSKDKINVFFGDKNCIDVIRTFSHKKLNELTAEQDFILGIMLGYDKSAQCERYLELCKYN